MNTKYLWKALSALVVLAGCARTMESVDSVPEEAGQTVIHATLENGHETKTVLTQDGSVLWQPGDKIAVFFNSVKVPFTAYNKTDAASAYFVGNAYLATGSNEGADGGPGDEYTYWGVYPYNIMNIIDIYLDEMSSAKEEAENSFSYFTNNPMYYCLFKRDIEKEHGVDYYSYVANSETEALDMLFSPAKCDGEQVKTYLFPWQQGVHETFDKNLNLAIAKSDDYHELAFYNVLGGIRFTVDASDITRVSFRGNNNEKLAGNLTVKMNEQGLPVITQIDDPEKTITVSRPGDRPFIPGVWYYVLMAPQQLTNGYTMSVYTSTSVAEKVVNESTEIKRSVFGSLSNVDAGLSFSPVTYPTHFSWYNELVEGEGYNIWWVWHKDKGPVMYTNSRLRLVPCTLNGPLQCSFPAQWLSLKPEVASVDDNGVVTAHNVGSTEIVCVIDRIVRSTYVSVVHEKSCFSLDIKPEDPGAYGEISLGQSLQLKAIPTPASCSTPPVWSSSDEAIATVDQNGLVTAVASGYVTITADIWGTKARYDIHVRSPRVEWIEHEGSSSLYPGETLQLIAKITPDSYDGPVVWRSEDDSILTVDQNGLVTAVAPGDTYIYASISEGDDYPASTWIRVEYPPISISPVDTDLYVGEETRIRVYEVPTDALNEIEWIIDDPEIVSITFKQYYFSLTALKEGETRITARWRGSEESCWVFVHNPD